MTPIKDKVLLQLDPEKMVSSGEGGAVLFLPDEDTIKYCRKCGNMMETLKEIPCVAQDIFEHDEYHDRPEFKGIHYDHDTTSVSAPVIFEPSRIGTVLAVGPLVREVHPNDRVMVDYTAGGSTENNRIVRECEILVQVVEE